VTSFTREEIVEGTRLGDFQVTAKPATDQEPYAAVDSVGRRVALAVVEREVSDEPGFARRFRRLARARVWLVHHNLLDVWGWGKSEHGLYLVMRRSRAPTLAMKLRRGALDHATSVRLLTAVAEGLTAGYAAGLVARALAPAAIKVEGGGGGRPLLGDLGITKPHHPDLFSRVDDSVYYASPEELREESLRPESNVYSLACILCECLTGAPPYPLQLRLAVPYEHLTEAPPALTKRRPELPPEIDSVIATAMAAEAPDRYDSPRTLMRAAAAALGVDAATPPAERRSPPETVPSPHHAVPSSHETAPARRLFPWGALALTVGVLALAAGAGGYHLGTGERSSEQQTRRPAVAPEVERLQQQRLGARRRLAAARRPSAQAAIAGELAVAYANADAALARTASSRALLDAVSRGQGAYAALSAAARRRDGAAYQAARLSVRAAERDLDRALSRTGNRVPS
jgi:Protein kinase domain